MLVIFENFEIVLVSTGNFKIFKNAFGEFVSNRPNKYVITSTIVLNLPINDNEIWFSK